MRRPVVPTHHDRHLNDRAGVQRSRSGPAARILWEVLKAIRLQGRANFLHSHAINGVVADFAEVSLGIAILLVPGAPAAGDPAVRRSRLAAAGYRVLMVPSEDVTERGHAVLDTIEAALAAPPTPPRA